MAGVLSAPSAGAQVLVGRTALHRVQVPAGAARPATVACPGGYLATSGGISAAAPGVVLLRAEPAGSGRYAFALANRGGNPRGVTVAVACRRLRAASATMDMKQLEPRSFQVGPGTQRSAVLTCPARRVAAGAGVDVGLGGTQLSVRRLAADLRGFSFTVRNAGRRARAVAVSGNCITVISRPGSPLLHLRVKVVTFRQPLGPGRRTITRAPVHAAGSRSRPATRCRRPHS
jgi:hypothetical protein